jgi:hypothetical protein
MPYFIILPAFVLYLIGMGVALTVASMYRPMGWLRPYLPSALLWSSLGFIASTITYFVVLVVAFKVMSVTVGERPSVLGGIAMGGLVFIAPFIVAGGGIVGGAALGIWRRLNRSAASRAARQVAVE